MNIEEAFAPLDERVTDIQEEEAFQPLPAPDRKPSAEERDHPKLGPPKAGVHKYRDVDGTLLGYTCRWNLPEGRKEIRPMRYGMFKGREGFHWKGWKGDSKRPLYGLYDIAQRDPAATVLVVEGEKAADRTAALFPDFVAVSPMNGAESPHLADWSPIAGRDVVIWPDKDQAGKEFARHVAQLALNAVAKSVRVVRVPPEFPDKWDVADPIPAGWDVGKLSELIAQAEPCHRAKPTRRPGSEGPDMEIATRTRRSPPKFPTSILGILEDDIVTLAAATSSPVDYTAMAILTAAAAVIGNSRVASPWETWVEPCCLWTAIVGTPSAGKSPALAPILEGLRSLEAEDFQSFDAEMLRWETAAESARQARELWEKKVKSAVKDGGEVPDLPSNAVLPEKPSLSRIIVSDTTPEALAMLHAKLPRGLMANRDELSGWLGGFDRYSSAGGERAFWIEAFGGRSYTVDRVKHGQAIHIPRLLVSVLGGIQPDKLTGLLLSGDDDGLAARMLMIWPDPVPPKRPTRPANAARVVHCLRQLRSLEMASDATGQPSPVAVKLTSEATEFFEPWWIAHNAATEDATGMFAGHLGKHPGLLLRIALVLEELWWAASGNVTSPASVSLGAVEAARVLLDEYLRPMAECVYGDAAMPEIERLETVLAKWILKAKPTCINARELRRKVRLPGLRDSETVTATLDALVEAGWVTSSPDRKGDTPGRKRADYVVNPLVYQTVP